MCGMVWTFRGLAGEPEDWEIVCDLLTAIPIIYKEVKHVYAV